MLTRPENADFAARHPDLLHLSPEALPQLANAGLVKRAQCESGCQPALALQDDGTLVATFSDGVVTRWPPGQSIHQSSCICPVPGLCRHWLIAALQFRAEVQNETRHEAQNETPAPAAVPGGAPEAGLPDDPAMQSTRPAALRSPGQASDEDLAALLPPAIYAHAQRERRAVQHRPFARRHCTLLGWRAPGRSPVRLRAANRLRERDAGRVGL